MFFFFFFFNDTATTEIYTLSLHDALPIWRGKVWWDSEAADYRNNRLYRPFTATALDSRRDRKSTRLNSSHSQISYAVFCLKKKNNNAPSYCDHYRRVAVLEITMTSLNCRT